ncbi:MAG: hypothetical protein ACOC6J_02285 [Spirochaetota bacterium]
MRLAKLALRMVISWRGSAYAAVAATVAVIAIATLAASIVVPIRLGVTERFRLQFDGELAATLSPDDAASAARESRAAGARVSLAAREAATLEANGELLLVRLARVDLPSELAFRGLTHIVDPAALASVSPNDAVLLGSGAHRSNDGTVGRLATQSDTHLARIVGTAPSGPHGAELLLHDPRALPGGAVSAAVIHVRARGTGRVMSRSVREALTAGTSLEPTGWRETAATVLAPVTRTLVLLLGILASLAAGTLLPGQLLLVRRAAESLQLLRAWGFDRGAVARLVVLVGAFSAGLAGTAGAGIGLAASAVLNAQERPAATLLPAGTAVELAPVLGAAPWDGAAAEAGPAATARASALGAVVTPSVGWALACVAIATLLGVVTALPSARIAATLDGRRDVWHW